MGKIPNGHLSHAASRVILLRVVELLIVGAIEEQTDVQTLNALKPLGPPFGVDLSMVEILLGSLLMAVTDRTSPGKRPVTGKAGGAQTLALELLFTSDIRPAPSSREAL
jgi:hypothetical protein